MNIRNAITTDFKAMKLHEILKQPINAIRGVTEDNAAKVKEAFRISTVEQLAKLRFAKWAWSIQELAKFESDGGSQESAININNAVDKAYETKTLTEILDSPMDALQGLSERQAKLLNEAFQISTVRDLANLKCILTARSMYFLALCEDPKADPNSNL